MINNRRRITNPVEIKRLWSKTNPAEKKQILGFLGLKPREKKGEFLHFEHEVRYFFIEVRHLDTGRKFLTIGLDIHTKDHPVQGLPRPTMMQLLGMEVPAVLTKFLARKRVPKPKPKKSLNPAWRKGIPNQTGYKRDK